MTGDVVKVPVHRGRRLRVGHLDHTQAPGGAELALGRTLRRARWDAVLFVPHERRKDGRAFDQLPTTTQLKSLGPRQRPGASTNTSVTSIVSFAGRIMGQAFALAFDRDFRRADGVHANTSRSAVYGSIASIMCRKPLVVHLRDMVDESSLSRIGFFAFRKLVLPAAAGVIANSLSTLDSAAPFLRRNLPQTVIPSPTGVDVAVAPHFREHVERVGMVARLDPWKGQDLLIRAFADVFGGTHVRLVFAGAAEFGKAAYESELRALVDERGIGQQVDFLGHVSDIAPLIDGLDICVQSSVRPEPLGQNVLQYLARGRPTIVSAEGGPAEWVKPGRNGLLFTPRDQASLAESLKLLADDAALRMTLGNAAKGTDGLLSDSDVASLHADFFLRVFGKHDRG